MLVGTKVKISQRIPEKVILNAGEKLIHNSIMKSFSGHEATVVEVVDNDCVKLDIDGERMRWPISCLTVVP